VRYQQDLQVALRERFKRLMTTGYATYAHELSLICDWIRGQPALRSLIAEIASAEQDVDAGAWIKSLQGHGNLQWPTTTEAGRARLIWELLQEMIGLGDRATLNFRHGVTSASNLNEAARAITETLVAPLFDYLTERIGNESSVLYLIERYVRRVEWFDRAELYEKYKANTRQGEKVYDDDLRRFLFEQGINMPFSQAKSAAGLSDVVSELDTDDPLICEVKLFDTDNHPKRGIGSGVNQVVQYAHDYRKNAAYLVIINLSGRALELPTDGDEKAWPRYIDLEGVRVHLVVIRALPVESASKLGKAQPVTVTKQNLVDPDA
jgi:hypothetical protein